MTTSLPTWQLLRRLARNAPRLFAAHALLWAIMNGTGLLPGLIVKAVFDTLTGVAHPRGGTDGLIALLAVLALGRMLLWVIAGYVEIVLRFASSGAIRRNLLRHILNRPGAEALPFSTGETIGRFRDDAYLAEDGLDWIDEIIGQGIVTLIAVTLLLRISVSLTLAGVLPLVFIVLIAQRASGALGHRRAASSQAGSRVTGALGDILAAVETVQTAGAEDRMVAHLRRLGERRRDATLADRLLTQALDAITANTASIGAGIIMLLAASGLRDGRLTAGDFVLFVAYIGLIADFTAGLGRFLAHYRQTGVAFARLGELLGNASPAAVTARSPLLPRGDLPPLPPLATVDDPLHRLEVRGLTCRHAPSGAGIAGIDFTLTRGSLTVITGRVGAGKTTLLRAVLGLLTRDAGEIRWNDQPVRDPAAFFVPPRAGYVPQTPQLFSDTLAANILLGLPEAAVDLETALRQAVLERDVAELDLGLATEVGARGVKLSGGQIQRAATARMLVRNPELLVIDDLSSALDIETEHALWDRLLASGEVTCLAVSHRQTALARADQILVLSGGRIVATGILAELLETSAAMRALWQRTDDPDLEW